MIKKFERLLLVVDHDGLTLPPTVAAARQNTIKCRKAVHDHYAGGSPPTEADLEAAHVEMMLNAADPAAVPLDALREGTAGAELHNQRGRLLRRALQQAEDDWPEVVRDEVAELLAAITAHFDTALWPEITKTVRDLGDVDPSDRRVMLLADAKARKAAAVLDDSDPTDQRDGPRPELVAQYRRLRAAYDQLMLDQPKPELDTGRNACHSITATGWCALVGAQWNGTPTSPGRLDPPWRSWADTSAMIIWLARNDHRPWFPSSVDRDQAWREAHPERIADTSRQQAAHFAVHGR